MRNASEQGIDSLGVSLVLGHLKMRGPNGKHLVSLVLGDIPDLGSHALQEDSHANLPVGIVLAENTGIFPRLAMVAKWFSNRLRY